MMVSSPRAGTVSVKCDSAFTPIDKGLADISGTIQLVKTATGIDKKLLRLCFSNEVYPFTPESASAKIALWILQLKLLAQTWLSRFSRKLTKV